jgi:hypothetical protein
LIEERRSEIIEFLNDNSEQEIFDFYSNEKNIVIIAKWKEQIKSIINDFKPQPIPISIEPAIEIPIEDLLEYKKDEI